MKIAFISGITGQDGSYLTELLLEKGYRVWGMIRRSSSINTSRIDHLYENENLTLKYGDLSDTTSLVGILNEMKSTYNVCSETTFEIYNLGAMSHVQVSFEVPEYTADIDAVGTMRLLNAIKMCGLDKIVRFYQASTSELYGKVVEVPQTEKTPFYPRSPYGVAKLYAHWIVKNYRESYGMFACSGILFNHESPRRGPTFVTRKITQAAARIKLGLQNKIVLGNLDSYRDWGFAGDYVEAMWMMLQQDKDFFFNNKVGDFVVATGICHSVRDFLDYSFQHIGVSNWQKHIVQDPRFMRPT